MQLGMIGLGRMGSNLVRRLTRAGHTCVVFDSNAAALKSIAGRRVQHAASLDDFVARLARPRAAWIMVPAGATGAIVEQLRARMGRGDIIIDGGNSYYRDDLIRAKSLRAQGIHYVDCGTSGGVFGLDRGYCLMIGGETAVLRHLDPIFRSIAPGVEAALRTRRGRGTASQAEHGYLHCGPAGAGHFVKMIHNGIEYGMMSAYAEGLNILKNAGAGLQRRDQDAETSPLRDPEAYRYHFDVGQVAEVWRRGSVIASWLLDLTARALAEDPELARFSGWVSDSGEGRWTTLAAIEIGVPAPVISAALYGRFESQGSGDYADRMLSAMRKQFGGHAEKKRGR